MGQKVNIPSQNQPFRRQASIGGNVSFRNIGDNNDNSFIALAKVTRVYYQRGKLDFKLTNTNSLVADRSGNGSGSAPIPVDFFGRRKNGQVFGHYRPVKIGDLIAVAYVNGHKSSPIVIGVYPNSGQDYEIISPSLYLDGDDEDAGVAETALAEQKIYPSMQLEYRSGSGTIAKALNGHSFLTVDDETSHQYDKLWQNYDTVGFFHNSSDAINPLKETAGDWLLVHEDNPLSDDGDNHRTRFFVNKKGEIQIVLMDNTSAGTISVLEGSKQDGFTISQYYDLQAKKSGDLSDDVYEPDFKSATNYVSLNVGKDQEIALEVAAKNSSKLELKSDGLYLNGKPFVESLNQRLDDLSNNIKDDIHKTVPSNDDFSKLAQDVNDNAEAARQAAESAKQAGEDAKDAGLAAEKAGEDAKATGDDIKKNVIYYANKYKGLHPGLHLDGGIVAITGKSYIEDSVIGSAMIEKGAIDRAKIADAAIGSAQIEDEAITRAKIADASINSAKIAKLAVTDEKVGKLSFDHMIGATLDAGQIKVINLTADNIKAHSLVADNLDIGKLSDITGNAGTINKGRIQAGDDPNSGVVIDNLDADNPNKYTPAKKAFLLSEVQKLNSAAEAAIDYGKQTHTDYSAVEKAKQAMDDGLAGLLGDMATTTEFDYNTVIKLEQDLQDAVNAFHNRSNSDIMAQIGTTANGKNAIYRGANDPVTMGVQPHENDMWLQILSNGTYNIRVWDGAQWINPGLADIKAVSDSLSNLPKSYYQPEEPVGGDVHDGDTWYKLTKGSDGKYTYVAYKRESGQWTQLLDDTDVSNANSIKTLQSSLQDAQKMIKDNQDQNQKDLHDLETNLSWRKVTGPFDANAYRSTFNIYYADSQATNTPVNGNFYLTVYAPDRDQVNQVLRTSDKAWQRIYSNDAWSDWTKVANNNDIVSINNQIKKSNDSISLNSQAIKAANGRIDDVDAQFKVETGHIKSSVEDISSNFNNMTIGGDNLLQNSDNYFDNNTKKDQNIGELTLDELNALRGKQVTVSVNTIWSNFNNDTNQNNRLGWEVSANYRQGNATKKLYLGAWKFPNSASGAERVSATFTVPDYEYTWTDGGKAYIQINGSGSVNRPQLQLGNKATEWNVGSADITGKIEKNSTLIDQTSKHIDLIAKDLDGKIAAIKITKDQIESIVSDPNGKVASMINHKADSISMGFTDNLKDLKDQAVLQGQSYGGLVLDKNGATLTSGSMSAHLNGTEGFLIESGNTPKFKVDSNGNLTINGDFTGGNISGVSFSGKDLTLDNSMKVNGQILFANGAGVLSSQGLSLKGGGLSISDSQGNQTTYIKSDGTFTTNKGYFEGDITAHKLILDSSTSSINMGGGVFQVNSNGDVTANSFTSNNVKITGGAFTTGAISSSSISGGTINGATITGNTIVGGTINGGTINGGTIKGTNISGGSFSSFESIPNYFSLASESILAKTIPDFSISSNGTYRVNTVFTDNLNWATEATTRKGDPRLWLSLNGSFEVPGENCNSPLPYLYLNETDKVSADHIVVNIIDRGIMMNPGNFDDTPNGLIPTNLGYTNSLNLLSNPHQAFLALDFDIVNSFSQDSDMFSGTSRIYLVLSNHQFNQDSRYEFVDSDETNSLSKIRVKSGSDTGTYDVVSYPVAKDSPERFMYRLYAKIPFSKVLDTSKTIYINLLQVGLLAKNANTVDQTWQFQFNKADIIPDSNDKYIQQHMGDSNADFNASLAGTGGSVSGFSILPNGTLHLSDTYSDSTSTYTAQYIQFTNNNDVFRPYWTTVSGEGIGFSATTGSRTNNRKAIYFSGDNNNNGIYFDGFGNVHAEDNAGWFRFYGNSNFGHQQMFSIDMGLGVLHFHTNNFRTDSDTDFYIDGKYGSGGSANLHIKQLFQQSQLSKKTNVSEIKGNDAFGKIMGVKEYNYQYKTDLTSNPNNDYVNSSIVIDDVHDTPLDKYKVPNEFMSEDKTGRNDAAQLAYLTTAFQYYVNKTDKLINRLNDKIKQLEKG